MECWIYSNFWSKSVAFRQKGHVTYFRNKKVRVNRKFFFCTQHLLFDSVITFYKKIEFQTIIFGV